MAVAQKPLSRTKELWQPFYEEELTDDDVWEISSRLNVFFQLLNEAKNKKSSN